MPRTVQAARFAGPAGCRRPPLNWRRPSPGPVHMALEDAAKAKVYAPHSRSACISSSGEGASPADTSRVPISLRNARSSFGKAPGTSSAAARASIQELAARSRSSSCDGGARVGPLQQDDRRCVLKRRRRCAVHAGHGPMSDCSLNLFPQDDGSGVGWDARAVSRHRAASVADLTMSATERWT